MYCLKRINTSKNNISFQYFFFLILHYILCSGEKTSTKDWPGFLDIKGRVRLDAFEKFLLELPQSRSRAIMVSQVSFCCARLVSCLSHQQYRKESLKKKNVAV